MDLAGHMSGAGPNTGMTAAAGQGGIDPNTLFMDLQAMDNTFEAVNMASQGMEGFMPMSGGMGQGGAASENDFAWFLLGGQSSMGGAT